MTHIVRQRRLVLLISFLLPVLIMGGYFVYRGMAPFGSSTVLTVDLGQQYVDFFAYLRIREANLLSSQCAHRFCIIPAACSIHLAKGWAVRCGVPTPTTFGAR